MMKDITKRNSEAAKKAKMIELLENAQPGEATTCNKTFQQRDILKHADVQTLQKKFELRLEMGKLFAYLDKAKCLSLLYFGVQGHMLISSTEVVVIYYSLVNLDISQLWIIYQKN